MLKRHKIFLFINAEKRIDNSRTISETYGHSPYGEPSLFDNGGGALTGSLVGNRFMYTGREYDGETGMYCYRFRYYDPESRRFMSIDPIGIAGGLNLYGYVVANPLMLNDPFGLFGLPEYDPEHPPRPIIYPPNPYFPPGFPPFKGNKNANKWFAWDMCNLGGPSFAKGACYIFEGLLKEFWLDCIVDTFAPGDMYGGWEKEDFENDFWPAIEEWKEKAEERKKELKDRTLPDRERLLKLYKLKAR